MKVAIIVAKFPSGWRALLAGEDIAEVKAAFKAVKVEGALVDEGEAASAVLFFDTGGNMRRKMLRTPEQRAELAAGKEAFVIAEKAKEQKLAAAAAAAEGSNAARALAEKAVALVTSEIAGAGAGAEVITREDVERMSEEIERLHRVVSDRYNENENLRAELARIKSSAPDEAAAGPGVAAPVAEATAEAPVAPVTDAAPAAPVASEPDDSGDAAERFGGGNKRATPKQPKR